MGIYIKLFEVLVPVFFVIGIGYFYGKKDPNFDTTFITNFAANIGLPALIIYSLTNIEISFNLFIQFFVYALVCVFLFAIISIPVLKLFKRDVIMELPPLILPNTGNMGLPICLFAYGSKGLAIATSITSVIILFHFTLGIFLASKKFSFLPLIKCIPFYAIIFSGLLLFFNIPAPKFLINTTMLIGYAGIFLVLMSLGVALSKLKVFNVRDTLFISLSRILFGPLIGFLFIHFLNINGYLAGVLLIQCSMPSAVLTYLVGKMYSPQYIVDNIAGTIVVSTFISFISIPLVVFFALSYFP